MFLSNYKVFYYMFLVVILFDYVNCQHSPNKNLKIWTSIQVSEWLESLSFSKYKKIFLENNIDGTALIYLNDQQLKDDMGITVLGDRIKIINCIADLKNTVDSHLYNHNPQSLFIFDKLIKFIFILCVIFPVALPILYAIYILINKGYYLIAVYMTIVIISFVFISTISDISNAEDVFYISLNIPLILLGIVFKCKEILFGR